MEGTKVGFLAYNRKGQVLWFWTPPWIFRVGKLLLLLLSLSSSSCSLVAPPGVRAERGYIASLSSVTFQTEERDVISCSEVLFGSWRRQTHTHESRREEPQECGKMRSNNAQTYVHFGVIAHSAVELHSLLQISSVSPLNTHWTSLSTLAWGQSYTSGA